MINSRTARLRAGTLVLALTAAPFAMGDTVKKKSGEKLEGNILKEDSLSVTIEVMTGPGIKDEQRVLKSDVTEIIRSTPDQKEADVLAKLVPAPDQMSDKGYADVIKNQLEPFLKKYPVSVRKAEVEGILKTYQEEMEKAKTGAQKLEGEWITPDELAWNRYNYEARLKRIEMQKLVKAKKYYDSYRAFLEIELEKPASVEFPKALALVKEALAAYNEELDRMTIEVAIKTKAREEELKTLTPDDRRRVEQAIKTEAEEYRAEVDVDRKNKVVVIRPNPLDAKTITDTQTQLKREITRIDKIDAAKTQAAAEKFRAGLKDMHTKSYLSAEKNFQVAVATFTKDSFVKEQAAAAKKASDEQARANAEAGVTTPGTAAPGTDPKKPAVPAKTAAGAPVSKPKPAPEPAAEEEASAPPEEENKMPMYLAGGAGVLLLVGILAKVFGKKKGEDE